MVQRLEIRNMLFCALFSALYVLGTYIRVPFPLVPIVLTNLFLLLGGFILGPLWGAYSVLLYLLLGTIGVPVFSAGGGIAVLLGPTGGYLIGYLLSVIIVGIFRNIGRQKLWSYIVGGALGLSSIYLCGVPWLQRFQELDLQKSIAIGVYPFLIGDGIKLIIAVMIIFTIQKHTPQFVLNRPEERSADG